MVMALAFHTKDPYRVEDTLNIFLFTDLSSLAGVGAGPPHAEVGRNLGGGTLTSFADTILLVGKQKVSPIAVWDEAESQLEDWAVFCTLFLGYNRVHPATYEMFLLLEETSGVSLRLWVQYHQQPTFPAALLCLAY